MAPSRGLAWSSLSLALLWLGAGLFARGFFPTPSPAVPVHDRTSPAPDGRERRSPSDGPAAPFDRLAWVLVDALRRCALILGNAERTATSRSSRVVCCSSRACSTRASGSASRLALKLRRSRCLVSKRCSPARPQASSTRSSCVSECPARPHRAEPRRVGHERPTAGKRRHMAASTPLPSRWLRASHRIRGRRHLASPVSPRLVRIRRRRHELLRERHVRLLHLSMLMLQRHRRPQRDTTSAAAPERSSLGRAAPPLSRRGPRWPYRRSKWAADVAQARGDGRGCGPALSLDRGSGRGRWPPDAAGGARRSRHDGGGQPWRGVDGRDERGTSAAGRCC